MLGKKGGEAQIYRIVLAQVSSGQEGRKTIDKLYAESENKHTSSALGDKQIVFVECLASVVGQLRAGPRLQRKRVDLDHLRDPGLSSA